jgi:hypothetical protein
MYKGRRGEVRQWMHELRKLAEQRLVPVFPPIGDLPSLASFRLDGHLYAPVAAAVRAGPAWCRARLELRSRSQRS